MGPVGGKHGCDRAPRQDTGWRWAWGARPGMDRTKKGKNVSYAKVKTFNRKVYIDLRDYWYPNGTEEEIAGTKRGVCLSLEGWLTLVDKMDAVEELWHDATEYLRLRSNVGRCGRLPARCVGWLNPVLDIPCVYGLLQMLPVFSIYIVLHECVIAFSILYIFRLCDYGCRDDDFLSMPAMHVSRISPCMLFKHWSAYMDWSSIQVQSVSSKKKSHLNYLFVMTIQLLLFTLPSLILFFVKLLWIRSLSWSLLFVTSATGCTGIRRPMARYPFSRCQFA